MAGEGLEQTRSTFSMRRDTRVPEELLHVPMGQVAAKWLFSLRRGWKTAEPASEVSL